MTTVPRPPYSEDAEQAVLAAMLIDESAVRQAVGLLDGAMFYAARHRAIYSAMVSLAESGTTIDPLTLSDRLTSRDALESSGGKDYIGFLVDAVPTSANIRYHAEIVREKFQLRRLIDTASTLRDEAFRGELTALELSRAAAQSLLPFTLDDADAPGFVGIKEAVWPTLELIEAQAGGKVFGLRTGYKVIDAETGGFQPGELVIVGGAEKMGKSVAALNFALRIADRDPADGGGGVAYVSAEMTKTAIVKRALGMRGKIEQRRLRNGKLIDDDWSRLAHAGAWLSQLPFWIDDEAEPSLADVVARCTALKAAHPALVAIVVDFLQLVHDREKGTAESVELKRVAYGLKRMAKKLGVVVFAPCQLNTKQIEELKEPRPRLKDLQGSSGMRQAADFICLLFRPSFYDSLNSDASAIEFNFAAAREASPFVAHLRWSSTTLCIDDPQLGMAA